MKPVNSFPGLLRAFFYTGVDETADRQRGFLHWMRRNVPGWEWAALVAMGPFLGARGGPFEHQRAQPGHGARAGALTFFAGEFPDSWTWDNKPENRAAHAALEGKPMPAFHVSDWINGGITAADIKG